MVATGLPGNKEKTGLAGVRGSSAKGILLVLAALSVCFGYFYFFTDIFRSKDEIAGQRDVISSEVRKAMPARNDAAPGTAAQQAAPAAPAAPAAGLVKPAAGPVPPQPPAVQVKKQQPEEKAPVAGGEAKTAPATVKAQEKSAAAKAGNVRKQAPVAKAVDKQPKTGTTTAKAADKQPKAGASAAKAVEKTPKTSASARKNSDVTTGAAAKSGAAAAKPAAGRKTGTDAEKSPAAAPAQAAAKKPSGAFTLVVGTYVMKSSMAADKAKLVKAGLAPVSVVTKKRNEPMNRLHVADFDSPVEAQAELSRVRAASKDAFLLKENGRYAVYAGSYYAYERAVDVREQLKGKGINPTLRKSVAPVPAYTLTAGSFASREDALEGAARLKKIGFKPFVSARK